MKEVLTVKRGLMNNDRYLELEKGVVCLLIGKNGCGKTTLIDSIKNAFESFGKSDLVIFGCKRVCFVEQVVKPFSFLDCSVAKVLRRNTYSKLPVEYTEYIDKIRGVFGINALEGRYMKQLSDGELKKVLFVSSLLQGAELCVFDEIDSSLDIVSRKMLYQFMAEIAELFKVAFLVTTHDLCAYDKNANMGTIKILSMD